jgi:hypothetical protein
MALVPLLWLLGLHRRGQRRGQAWYWLAGAFFISWLADAAVDLGANADLASMVYQVSQSALIGAILLDRDEAIVLTITLVVVAIAATLWRGPDLLLNTVASLSVAGIAYNRRALARVRWSLLVTFGAGWVAWMAYALHPGWAGWLAYQAARLVGTGLFCWAATEPAPRLTVMRRAA